jgi:hypothetical protein
MNRTPSALHVVRSGVISIKSGPLDAPKIAKVGDIGDATIGMVITREAR